MTPAWLMAPIAYPVFAPLTGGTSLRGAALLEAIVAQFEVDSAERYRPRDVTGDGQSETFCNLYLNDVTRALGCEIPRVWPVGADWKQLRANDQRDWLVGAGRYGWSSCSESDARVAAEFGKVAVAAWKNPTAGRSGHVAILVPSHGSRETAVSQAGAKCFLRAPLSVCFPQRPEFFVHE